MSECKITHVAVKANGKLYSLPEPARHSDVIRLAVEDGAPTPIKQRQQGFLDSEGQWLTRADAFNVALKAGQVESREAHRCTLLFSEDLW